MNNQIFQINQTDSKIIDQWIDAETGEIIDQELAEKQFQEKSEGLQKAIIGKIQLAKANQEVIKMEMDRLKSLMDSQKRYEENYKKFLTIQMSSIGTKKLDFGFIKAVIRKNQPKLDDIQPGADISSYIKIEIIEKVDKIAIKKDLKDGKEIKGCRLIQNERLDII